MAYRPALSRRRQPDNRVAERKASAGKERKNRLKLIIASNNAHKLEEIKAILGDHFGEILSLREAGIEH